MRVKFYLSNLNSVAKEKAYKDMHARGGNILILTPDRNTLNIEKEVIRRSGGKAVFDINVSTFSRIAKSYLMDRGLYKNVLTKHASVALIKKLLMDHKKKLKVFGSSVSKKGFCEKIFETICLYKSCKITPEDFYITDKYGLLDYKLHDIQMIYNEYERYMGSEYTDSFNQLDLFYQSISTGDYKDVDIYIMDYEDVTPAIARIVAKISKYAKSVNICTTYSKACGMQSNANIYTNDVYYTLANVMQLEGVVYTKEYVAIEDRSRAIVASRLYGSGSVAKQKHIGLQLVKANNIAEELKYVLTDIKKAVLDGECKMSDIAVIVSNLEVYKEELNSMLNRLDISYYYDQADALADNVLCRIILLILDIACTGITKYNILQLIDTGVCKLSTSEISAYKNYIGRIDAKGKYLYTIPDKIQADDELKSAIDKIYSLIKSMCISSGTIEEYKDAIFKVLEGMGYDEYYEMMYARYIEGEDILNAKKLTQSYNKLSTMWNEMTMLFQSENFDPKDFYEVFTTFVEDIKLSLTPIKVNSLIISDFESSYITDARRMYYIGANDDALPKYSMETALLSDKEIERVNSRNKLAPTINMINKRKKFKLFEMVQKATEKIVMSYVCVNAKGEELYPSMIYEELSSVIEASPVIDAGESIVVEDANKIKDKLIKNNITKKMALYNMCDYIKEWNLYNDIKDYRQNVTSVYHALDDVSVDVVGNATYTNTVKKLTNGGKLYFHSSEVSPSQFEKFANCPYAHYLNYGLKLRQNDIAKVSTNDIGNIIHDYMKIVIYDLYNYRSDDEFVASIKKFATDNLAKVLASDRYARFQSSAINSTTIRGLYEEVVRITLAILEQMRNTDYEPYHREYSINAESGKVEFVLPTGKKISIVGKVDRIDINKEDNTFYIIDYKTGNSSFSNFTDFVAGKKIQLFCYMMLYKNASGMRPVGAFYLPIDNKLEKTKKYRYQGFFDKNLDIIGNIDNTLRQFPSIGTTLRLSRKKEGDFYKSNAINNLAISEEDMNRGMEYLVENLYKRACMIEDGCIDINPLLIDNVSACKYCEYGGICNFNIKYGNRNRKVSRVNSLKDVLGNEEVDDVQRSDI